MPHYPDLPNVDLLERLPLDARVILDVGCYMGALGAEYKRRNPAARYLGIETESAPAQVARTRLDRVAVGDVEADPNPFGPEQYDCIVYGDVLEHLVDPWSVLRRQAAQLSPTGVVLISMPNLEHWSFAERLLRGTWTYEDQGLFDAGHLRWFTWAGTRRALESAGLAPHDVSPRIFDAKQAEAFVQAMAPSLAALGIDRADYLRRAMPLQYVWRARRTPVPQIHVTSTMLPAVGGVSHVRVIEPMRALATDCSVSVEVVPHGAEIPANTEGQPRIYVWHRPALIGPDGLARVRSLIDKGWLVVCEFDDHPGFIPILQQGELQNFRAVHAVQTSTEALADVLRAENPEVAVFPNAVMRLPEPVNFTDPNRLTMLFAALNREEDWPALVPALNRVAAAAGDRLQFQVVNDHGLFEALATPHKNFTPLCDYETYQRLLGASELSFMPLRDTPFNRCKSDLKFIEAASYRVLAVASPTVYGRSIEDGQTGLVFKDAEELEHKLMLLLANPASARQMADAAREHVKRHRMMAFQISRRAAWYRSLWARRQELHEALLARVPELGTAAEPVA
jgi:SAM-dependent methyltransferase